jgi:hypothetical protein
MAERPTRRDIFAFAVTAAASAAAGPRLLAQPPDDEPRVATGYVFFNLAHEDDHRSATYWVVGGRRRRRLIPLSRKPAILDAARRTNRFLQDVPDDAVTHYLPPFSLTTGQVVLHYVLKLAPLGKSGAPSGAWSMSSMFFTLPPAAVRAAHARAPRSAANALLLSEKRAFYGHSPAVTLDDFLEEESLKDAADHATSLVGLHPEALSIEGGSAAHIQRNLIQGKGDTRLLPLMLKLRSLGEAAPETSPTSPNAKGWATLRPLTDPDTGAPLHAQLGSLKGLALYHPEWHSEVKAAAGAVMKTVIHDVKNDVSLGADVTPGTGALTTTDFTGTVWHRRDGVTSVSHTGLSAPGDAPPKYTLTTAGTYGGYAVHAEVSEPSSGGVLVSLAFENWYVRWLGLWVQFHDGKGNAIATKDLPANLQHSGNSATKVLVGVVSPEWTLYGIPLEESTAAASFMWPDAAESAGVEASGLSFSAPSPSEGSDFIGTFLTLMFNMVVPAALIALGAAVDLTVIQKLVVVPGVNLAFREIALLSIDLTADSTKKNLFTAFWKALVGQAVRGAFKPIVEFLARIIQRMVQYVVAAELEDAIPIAGQIVEAVTTIGALADIAETTGELIASPPAYESTLVITQDVTVTIDNDPKDDTLPKSATLCVVKLLSDAGGAPRVAAVVPDVSKASLSVMFPALPRGGRISITAGFYSGTADAPMARLVGQASSGLVPNTSGVHTLVLTEIPVPIEASTVYVHKRKTTIDASGALAWAALPAPSASADPLSVNPPKSLCDERALCDFRGVTVRQGTGSQQGYVGWAYQGQGSSCAGGDGKVDRLSNIGTAGGGGYATVKCGLQSGASGAKLVYSLLGRPAQAASALVDFYLDPATRLVRGVNLDAQPPTFDDPSVPGTAWGKLNFDSTALVLHPTGTLVSINEGNHHFESVRLPDAPLEDAEAGVKLVAKVYGGEGARPGLLSSPRAAAVSPDGVIVVLEAGNNRLQAFDVAGNAVRFFKKQPRPWFLALDATKSGDTVYLDVAIEHTGYVYVLSYDQGSSPFAYRLDVYAPDQRGTAPITTTPNVYAARVTVDFWRNVYTLNYDELARPGYAVEPSVSLWAPELRS